MTVAPGAKGIASWLHCGAGESPMLRLEGLQISQSQQPNDYTDSGAVERIAYQAGHYRIPTQRHAKVSQLRRVKNRQSVAESHEETPGVIRTWLVDSRIVRRRQHFNRPNGNVSRSGEDQARWRRPMRDEQDEILKLKRDLVSLRVFWLLFLAEAQPVILLHVGEFPGGLMLIRKYSDSCG